MSLHKDALPHTIITARTTVRRAKREDLLQIASWPAYAWPYEVFNMNTSSESPLAEPLWWQRIDDAGRCNYSVVLPDTDAVIGVIALVRIDWQEAVVNNMGVRIHPDYCDKGYGSEALRPLLSGALDSGIGTIRLDVAAPNQRAVRCYEKSGMKIVDEFWREHSGEPIDPSDQKWSFALPHLRHHNGEWSVRFWWMETSSDRQKT